MAVPPAGPHLSGDPASAAGPLRRRTLRLVAGVVLCFVPVVVVALSPWSEDARLLFVGLLPALVALDAGPRVPAIAAVVTPVAVLIGLLLSGSPWLAGLFLALLCVGVAWSYTRGWQTGATYVAIQAAFAAVAAPRAVLPGGEPLDDLGSALLATGLVFLGGAWVAVVARLLLHDVARRRPVRPSAAALRRFAVVLAAAVGLGAVAAKTWVPTGNAWWIVLTILVVVQPDEHATAVRTAHRVLGTVLGGLAAGLLFLVIGNPAVTTALGVLLGVVSGVVYLTAPYWVFVTVLTPALVLATFTPETAFQGDAERVAFTIIGAAAALAVAGLSRAVLAVARHGTKGSAAHG